MNNSFSNLRNIFIKYRLIITYIVPVFFFLTILSFFVFPQKNTEAPSVNPIPTPIVAPSQINTQTLPSEEKRESELYEPLESIPGFTGTENLPDSTIRYSFSSHAPERPNLIILKGEYDFVFQRNLILPDHTVKIEDYTYVYGAAPWVFRGSVFYGPEIQTYIYPDLGVAFIANPITEEVLEYHLFDPMTVEEYIRKFGEDIPANPEP